MNFLYFYSLRAVWEVEQVDEGDSLYKYFEHSGPCDKI